MLWKFYVFCGFRLEGCSWLLRLVVIVFSILSFFTILQIHAIIDQSLSFCVF